MYMNNPFALLSLIVALPFLGMLFVLTAKDSEDTPGRNAFNVCIFTVIANITLIWRVFMVLNEKSSKLQLLEKFNWLSTPDINIMFGVDTFSLLLILAIHISILIGLVGVRQNRHKQKTLMVLTLLFLSTITGFFVAADIFSFYIFFEAMLVPLFMVIGMFGEVKRKGPVFRFFLYNFIGALLLFSATMLIYRQYGSITLLQLRQLAQEGQIGAYIYIAIGLAFLSRIPIWPFHYWISSISSAIKNPLCFIIMVQIPLTALYGCIRFIPVHFSINLGSYLTIISIIGAITMFFIALIGFINKDTQYKVFAYITVYYIMYLLGILTNDDVVLRNIGYSLFSFIITISSLEVLSSYIRHKEQEIDSLSNGFLCRVRRLSFAYSFMTMAAVGLPVSAVFVNNFLIISKLISQNLELGLIIVFALIIAGITLLQELSRLKTDDSRCQLGRNDDISFSVFCFMLFIMFMLLMSFIKPLWFVINE